MVEMGADDVSAARREVNRSVGKIVVAVLRSIKVVFMWRNENKIS